MKETKDSKILWDENGETQFDFSNALNVFEPHELASMYSDYLSDVDFVIEEEDKLICLEYKNSNTSNVENPEAFQRKITGEEFWKKAAKKFYGTLFLIWACDINQADKPIHYVLLMEVNPSMDVALKKRFTSKIMRQLPFKYNNKIEIKRRIIDEFAFVDIMEWNEKYSQYPICEAQSVE